MTDHSKCRNSNRSFTEAERDGICPTCDGRGELISNFGGRHAHVKCPECNGRSLTAPVASPDLP